jgi:hypothetical protein
VILAASYLIYGLAGTWPIIVVAMIAYWIGNNTAVLGCGVTCANCLKSEERATGMAICETFGMGLLGLAAPLVGAWLVTAFGGINVQGIRPLFFVAVGGVILTFVLILTKMSDRRWNRVGSGHLGLFQGITQVFKEGPKILGEC